MTSTTGVPPSHRNAVLVRRMRAALDGMSGVGSLSMSTDELGGYLADLQGLLAQVQAQLLSAVREADRREIAKSVSAANTGAWLSSALQMRLEEAGRAVELARDLDTHLPVTQQALQAGDISADHADVIARSMRRLPAWVGVEKRSRPSRCCSTRLAPSTRKTSPGWAARSSTRSMRTVPTENSPSNSKPKKRERSGNARSSCTTTRTRSPRSFRVALEPLSKPRPTDANGPDLRTPAQRMGDGFHELLRRFLASGAAPTHGGERPQIVLTIDPNKLRDGAGTGQLLHTGASISARTVQEIACDAQVSVYTPGSERGGASLSDGVRLYTGKVRKLLELRDPRLRLPGLQSAALVVPGPSHRPVEQGRSDHPRERRSPVRLPPPTHPPRHLASQHRARRAPRVHPTRMDRQTPQPTPQPPHQKLRTRE